MKLTRFFHRAYKLCLSPLLGERCRFHPTCSSYCAESFEKHGFFRGAVLSLTRVLRCNPLFEGGFDPVPPLKKNCSCKHHADTVKANISGSC